MTDEQDIRQKFTVISGGRDRKLYFCGIPVSIQADDHSPLGVDALACEEDRFLIMTSAPDIHRPAEHPLRIINRAWNQSPLPVGSIQKRAGRPIRFLAIVHDLDRSPTCRPIWILAALAALKEQLFLQSEIRSLALPLFGVRYGTLSASESLNLLRQAMTGTRWPIRELVLLAPRGKQQQILKQLDQDRD